VKTVYEGVGRDLISLTRGVADELHKPEVLHKKYSLATHICIIVFFFESNVKKKSRFKMLIVSKQLMLQKRAKYP